MEWSRSSKWSNWDWIGDGVRSCSCLVDVVAVVVVEPAELKKSTEAHSSNGGLPDQGVRDSESALTGNVGRKSHYMFLCWLLKEILRVGAKIVHFLAFLPYGDENLRNEDDWGWNWE